MRRDQPGNGHRATLDDPDNGHWQDLKNASTTPSLNRQIKEEITAVWTQIANNFKSCGDWLMFEGFNELNDGGWGHSAAFKANPTLQCNVLNEWLQTFVDAVRATGEYYPDAKEAIDVLIKGWCTENASYTLQSVYDSAPRFP